MKYMTYLPLLSLLIPALGHGGMTALLFSYFGEEALPFGILGFAVTLILTLLFRSVKKERQIPILTGALFFLIILFFAGNLLKESALSLAVPFLHTLSEPYDMDLASSLPQIGATVLPFELYILFFTSLFFAAPFLMVPAILSALISLAVILTGFYFGLNPPFPGLILSAAFLLTLPSLLHKETGSAMEVPVFLSALLLGIFFSILIPKSHYDQPALLGRMQEKIVSFVDPYDPIFHAGSGYAGIMKGAAGRQKLGSTSGVRYTGRILADMETADVSHRLYLRSWSGSVYENNQWKDLPDKDYASVRELFEKNQGEWYDQGAWLMEVIARSPRLSQMLGNYLSGNGDVPSLKKDFSINHVYDTTDFFLLPYDASFGAPLFTYDRSPVSREGKAYSTYLWDLPSGPLLSMMDNESISDPYYLTYVGEERKYRDFVYAHYLTVPDSVKEAIASTGFTAKVHTWNEKRERVEEIHHFLSENYRYTTNPGKTPQGKDFITYFLTESKKGYCTSFASAAVMLLRASGIPARYVTGLTEGREEINAAPLSPSGLHKVSINDHHAHAWAEVYVDGLGWRPAEMTPGYEGTDNPFPIPPEKNRNDTGAPDGPKEKGNQERKNPQDNRNSTPPKQSPAENPKQDLPRPIQKEMPVSRSGTSPVISILSAIILIIMTILLFLRLTAVDRMISASSRDQKSFNPLLDYMERLTSYAGISLKGSYEERKKAYRRDERLKNLAFLIDRLVASRFSGKSLSIDERKEAASLIRKARKNMIRSLPLLERIRFLLLKKL